MKELGKELVAYAIYRQVAKQLPLLTQDEHLALIEAAKLEVELRVAEHQKNAKPRVCPGCGHEQKRSFA
jgi:hypothetical protein